MSQVYVGNGSGGGGSAIQTINGDVGSITGSTVTIYAHNSVQQAGSSVQFVNSGTISTLQVTDVNANTIVGLNAGNASITGIDNTFFGTASGSSLTSGFQNIGVGFGALDGLTSGSSNIGIGQGALSGVNTGGGNLGIGDEVAQNFNGSNNILIGTQAGSNYTGTEADNILMGNLGVLGESNAIRIGTPGSGVLQQNSCHIAGITGVTTAGSSPVAVNSAGQLNDLGFGTSGQVLTSNGAATSPTWKNFIAFSVAMNSTQTLTNNAVNNVTYDTVLIDTAGGYSSGIYTIPVGGTGNWILNVVGNFTTSVSFIDCDMFFNKNSGTFLVHLQPSTPSDGIAVNNGSGSAIVSLTAGDTIQISVFAQTTGSNPFSATGVSNGYFNIFSGHKIP